MRPQYNYYLTTFTQQEITLMDNNTYCLVLSSSTFSALELAESGFGLWERGFSQRSQRYSRRSWS